MKNETIANISQLPERVIEIVRRSLRGEQFVEASELFDITASPQHGHVQSVHRALRALEFDKLLGGRRCREKDLVLAMVTARIIRPQSKLATTRWWHTTTIPETFDVYDADQDDLYAAMDWLLERQPEIEKKLAKRHLQEAGLVLYDLSSSYFEGHCCPLAKLGHSRDGKKGTLQVNYGLVTDERGCPVSVSVFPGNTGDSTTVLHEVEKVQSRFGLDAMVIVGDRGMISQRQINELSKKEGVDWITALRSGSIRKLMDQGHLQLGLFDERNLFEFSHPDFPGERLVACRNLELADRRAKKRQGLLEATSTKLEKIRERVQAGKLTGAAKIGAKVGGVLDSRKVGKHFDLEIGDESFDFSINGDRVDAEAALDGIYVIRTSVKESQLDPPGVVLAYKKLSSVERAFRSFKTVDLHVRPIRHWSVNRVQAHIFLCLLAYYVQYHMQESWRPLLYSDEEAWTRTREDPIGPAQRSEGALRKAETHRTSQGDQVHSFRTLIAELGSIVRNVCRRKGADKDEPPIIIPTKPSPLQERALQMLSSITV